MHLKHENTYNATYDDIQNDIHLWHIPLAQVVLLAPSVASKRNWLGLIGQAMQDKERQAIVDGL